jgi:hypothetical protein
MAKVNRNINVTVSVELSLTEVEVLLEVLDNFPKSLDSADDESSESKELRLGLIDQLKDSLA